MSRANYIQIDSLFHFQLISENAIGIQLHLNEDEFQKVSHNQKRVNSSQLLMDGSSILVFRAVRVKIEFKIIDVLH